jgi:hypothetical protein
MVTCQTVRQAGATTSPPTPITKRAPCGARKLQPTDSQHISFACMYEVVGQRRESRRAAVGSGTGHMVMGGRERRKPEWRKPEFGENLNWREPEFHGYPGTVPWYSICYPGIVRMSASGVVRSHLRPHLSWFSPFLNCGSQIRSIECV